MADGEAAGIQLGEERLHVAQNGFAGSRITHVADRGVARQAIDNLAPREGVADQTEAALGMKTAAVEGDDAGRLLAAVLKRVQPERRYGGRVRMTKDAKHTAFLTQAVRVEVEKADSPHEADPRSSLLVCAAPG